MAAFQQVLLKEYNEFLGGWPVCELAYSIWSMTRSGQVMLFFFLPSEMLGQDCWINMLV